MFEGLVQDGLEHPELLIAHDASVVLLGLDEPRGGPAECHVAVLPVGHTTCPLSYPGIGRINQVGGGQATAKRPGQCQPVDREQLAQALTQAGRC